MKVASNIIATEAEIEKLGGSLTQLTSDLTLPNPEYENTLRFGKGRFHRQVDKFICYLKQVGKEYIIPRYYFGNIEGGIRGRDFWDEHNACPFKLRDYQEEFVKENIKELYRNTGILLEAPCGSGKTVMALYFIAMRGKQSLVLVPTYYLAKQWAQRIEQLTPWTYVILTSKDATIPTDRDITIVVMDLFSCRVLPKELVDNIGHVILDEAHRVGAETYLPILEEIPAMYRTALTATFRRSDGVHKILQYHFGEHFKMESRFPKPKVYAVKTGVEVKGVMSKNRAHSDFLDFLDAGGVPYVETKSAVAFNPVPELRERVEKLIKSKAITKKAYKEIVACINKGSEMAYASLDSYLNENASRRKVAIKIIQECLDAGRTVLFLSKRKDTLRALNKYFAKYNPMLIVAETNARSEEDEKYLQESCPVILGVTQLAKEGLDIDRLDTLIIHLPMADTEQAIGRISRLHPKKQPPVAFYLLDNCAMTYSVFNKAKKFIAINGEYKGDITLKQLKAVL